ncbi:hypothetical protein, partial [Arthrobacter sp. JCM 19049]|uniref:hypothetical protein n=1 Tax=Arthrobacter sp. JCM 19049 TaxID=1460643 RepID=UPI00243689CC
MRQRAHRLGQFAQQRGDLLGPLALSALWLSTAARRRTTTRRLRAAKSKWSLRSESWRIPGGAG